MASKTKEQPRPAVLLDTPVWQAYFHKEEGVFHRVNALMDAGRVCSLDLIIAELVKDATTEEEIKAFLDFTRIFPILREPEGAWTRAATWARKAQRKGEKWSLRNSYVLFMAKTAGVLLWTREPSLFPVRKSSAFGVKYFPEQGETE